MSQQASPQGREHKRLEHQSNLVEEQDQEGKEHDGKDLLSSHGERQSLLKRSRVNSRSAGVCLGKNEWYESGTGPPM